MSDEMRVPSLSDEIKITLLVIMSVGCSCSISSGTSFGSLIFGLLRNRFASVRRSDARGKLKWHFAVNIFKHELQELIDHTF